MSYSLILAIGILLVAVAGVLLLRKRLGWATVLIVIGLLAALFARPIEATWDAVIAANPGAPRPGTTPRAASARPTSPPTNRLDQQTPDPPATEAPVTDAPASGPIGDVINSRPPEPVYLSNSTRTSGGKGIVSIRPQTIQGREYPHAIYMCSELSLIPNINCNSDTATTWWAEYVAPADMRYFRTVVGLSDSSPGDCRVSLRLEVNGSAVFDEIVGAGDRYGERAWPVRPGTRVVFRVRPIAGAGRCMATLGDPRFTV